MSEPDPMRIALVRSEARLPDEERIAIVECKGQGHPDTICDSLAEELSLELSRFYLEHAGGVLHHNVDKVLLAAGASRPRFGGGEVVEPMQIFLAGRATAEFDDVSVPIAELAEATTRRWLSDHLYSLDAQRHVVVTSLVKPGSSELVRMFDQRESTHGALANDTSCGVGYAPLSELERVVTAVSQRLASAEARADPALGEDVKVMAIRHGDDIELTVACAMIDAALRDIADYAKATRGVEELVLQAASEVTSLPIRVAVNAGDDLASGRIYLTVTGTSAEAGDDGQTGRGNRVNGLITPGRPMTMESVAGKNPVNHVGKLYNLAAGLLAERIVTSLPQVRCAECRLVSRIGQPIEQPRIVEVRVTGADPAHDSELEAAIEQAAREQLAHLSQLADELVRGDLALNRWPLHS
jgi:S-adenosylmethionine synthetase